MHKVYVVIEIYGHITKIQALAQGNLGLNQQTIPNDIDEYPKHIGPQNLYPVQVCDDVFEQNAARLVAQYSGVAGRILYDDEFSSEDSPEPDDQLATEEDACVEEDAMGRKGKQPQLKGKYAKLAADAAAAAAAASTAARAEARAQKEKEQARSKGKGKGKHGTPPAAGNSAGNPPPVASTSAEAAPAAAAAADVGSSPTPGQSLGTTEDGAETQDEPPDATAEPADPMQAVLKPIPRRASLPYTFYNVHGKNIKLCSSDTVAARLKGYKDGIAVISQPLRRGHNFRFRVDKTCDDWLGSVTIGAVGVLPQETPSNGVHLEPPCWVISSDLLNDNGTFFHSMMGMALDDLKEQSVLTIHFRFTSELILQVNGKLIGCIATVPRRFSHVFPTIDLYGRVCQISVLLHPYVIASGASLDLPVITENCDEALDDQSDEEEDDDESADPESTIKKKKKAYSQDNLMYTQWEPLPMPAGPSPGLSFMPYCVPTPLPFRTPTPIPMPVMQPLGGQVSNPVKKKLKKCKVKGKGKSVDIPAETPMAQSLNLPVSQPDNSPPADNNEVVNRCIQKSHSTHNFSHLSEEPEPVNALRHTYSVGSRVGDDAGDVHEQFCDTNIRHNDRYPEANDVDNLDNEIMDALTMDAGNLPDLTEEQSSSIDESTRRDDFWSESLSVEYLHYLNRILCLDQEGGGQSLESEWEASGEGCEHLHLVLKYWNYLVLPYPELRQAVSWGQVRCYCANCQPDASTAFAGWVRIERIDGVGAAQRGFWHVVRSTLGAAQVAGGERGPVRRPRCLSAGPCASPPFADIWFDEEGKPHHTVLAIEIDVEGSDAENDRLLAFLIYLKPHVAFAEDNPPSLDE